MSLRYVDLYSIKYSVPVNSERESIIHGEINQRSSFFFSYVLSFSTFFFFRGPTVRTTVQQTSAAARPKVAALTLRSPAGDNLKLQPFWRVTTADRRRPTKIYRRAAVEFPTNGNVVKPYWGFIGRCAHIYKYVHTSIYILYIYIHRAQSLGQ